MLCGDDRKAKGWLACQPLTRFAPSAQLPAPYVMLGVNVVAADTDEARFLASSGRQSFASLRSGHPIQLPPPSKEWQHALSDPVDPNATLQVHPTYWNSLPGHSRESQNIAESMYRQSQVCKLLPPFVLSSQDGMEPSPSKMELKNNTQEVVVFCRVRDPFMPQLFSDWG